MSLYTDNFLQNLAQENTQKTVKIKFVKEKFE